MKKPATQKTGAEFYGFSHCSVCGGDSSHLFYQVQDINRRRYLYWQAVCQICRHDHPADGEAPVVAFENKNKDAVSRIKFDDLIAKE